jgi:hypothetical protein
MVYGGISASTTVTGDMIITGGLAVGYAGPAINDTITLVDVVNYLDFNLSTAPIYAVDSTDFMFYDRTNNVFKYEIANTVIHTVTSGAAFFAGYIKLPEITAPASASANQANLYVRDNSGTSRLAFKDDQGVETFLGGPGQWELIAQTNILTSVASITYNLTKRYSRLTLAAVVSISGANLLMANISDDAGITLVSCRSSFMTFGSGDINSTNTLAIGAATNQSVGAKADINRADKTGPKQWNSLSGRQTVGGQANIGQTASCGPVNAIIVAGDSGNLVNGIITLYGLIAI